MWGCGGRLGRRVGSVATGALLLHGCATYTVEPVGRSAGGGAIAVRPARRGAVIAAPHGTSDPRTAEMAEALARRTGFGLVVATGFTVDGDAASGSRRRYQVNRPSEGVPGQPPSTEIESDEARRMYEVYRRRVLAAARGPLTFYVEIHGNSRREAAGRIEIATVGVDLDDARRLRTLLELSRDAHLRAHPEAPRLDARVELADPIVYAASGAKRSGILGWTERGLHIELPRVARQEWRAVYTAILADFLAQAAALPLFR